MSSRRLNKNEARKKLIELSKQGLIFFTKHALVELKNDDLDRTDAVNVLCSSSSKIEREPEYKNGTWRYSVTTRTICVVITFQEDPTGILVITVFKMTRIQK